MTAPVALEPVPVERREELRALFQLYLHDLSEYDGALPGADGHYAYAYFDAYWQDANRWPYFIVAGGRVAGFVLIREAAEIAPGLHSIAEFFILRPFRRGGIGTAAARLALATLPGRWRITQLERNTPAIAFWRRIAAEASGGSFDETREEGDVVQTFALR